MKVRLEQVGAAAFSAKAEESGAELVLDGKPEIGGEGRGMRPTELFLSGLAGCGAMDVVHILRRQKEPLEQLTIDIEGDRSATTPARFTKIHLKFTARGAVDRHKLERAVALSVDKYCTVRNTLDPALELSWEVVLET
jgi:putative redox protein